MTTALFDDANTINDLTRLATAHGDQSGNDHEIGDLQSLILKAWTLMTPDMRREMLCSAEVSEVVESATGVSLVTNPDELGQVEWETACQAYGLDTSFQYDVAQKLDVVNHARLEAACSSLGDVSESALLADSAERAVPIPTKPRRSRP